MDMRHGWTRKYVISPLIRSFSFSFFLLQLPPRGRVQGLQDGMYSTHDVVSYMIGRFVGRLELEPS